MLIAFANRKGGVGKTTLATNIAAEHAMRGNDVKAIDADFDEYLYMWGMLRRQNEVNPNILLSKMTGNIYPDLMAEKESGRTIIVDVGGKHSPELVYAIGACDVLVLPVRAGQYDVWSLSAMAQMIREMRAKGSTIRVIPVMNAISADERSVLNEGLRNELKGLEDAFGKPVEIVQRTAFSMAAMEGKGVCELKRSRDTEKAQDEMKALYDEVFK